MTSALIHRSDFSINSQVSLYNLACKVERRCRLHCQNWVIASPGLSQHFVHLQVRLTEIEAERAAKKLAAHKAAEQKLREAAMPPRMQLAAEASTAPCVLHLMAFSRHCKNGSFLLRSIAGLAASGCIPHQYVPLLSRLTCNRQTAQVIPCPVII